jgi:hypothetical protein
LIARARSALSPGLVLVMLAGCGRTAEDHAGLEVVRRWSAPTSDVGAWCADVDDARLCWLPGGKAVEVPRAVPSLAPPTPLGFRCTGQGPSRTCEARDDAEPFVCSGPTCVQKHPRQPDDGPWQCADEAGVAVCVAGEPTAEARQVVDPAGWVCGRRRRAGTVARDGAQRVCVDPSPDFPEGRAHQERCHWSYDHGVVRTCTRDPDAHVLADACDAGHPCVVGATCAAGRCAPERFAADCVDDADCGASHCRFGSCTVAP